MFSKEIIALAKPCIEAIKKISKGKWEWKPERGELFGLPDLKYHPDNLGIYLYTVDHTVFYYHIVKKKIVETQTGYLEYCIPLLHWERIERVLKGMGYCIFLTGNIELSTKYTVVIGTTVEHIGLLEGKSEIKCFGKTRQLAVMRAVIELGKETQVESN